MSKRKDKKKKKSFLSRFFTKLIITIILVPTFVVIGIFSIAHLYKMDLYRTIDLDKKIETTMSKDNYVTSSNISNCLLQAVVSIEDHRFFSHNGFDIISFSRAMFANMESGKYSQGGSTLTQQLAKNLYLSSSKNVFRKAVELLIALDIEKAYSKEKILELYVNVIYYGRNSFGIYDASRTFFNKNPINLTHDESAYLAGLTQSPTTYSTNEDLANKRKELVLDAMSKYSNCTHNKKVN